MVISSILVISIVIDSDRGHCYEHLKKINLRWKLSAWHVFECLCMRLIFELPEMAKNEILTFQAQPVWVRVISSIILYVNVVLDKFQW